MEVNGTVTISLSDYSTLRKLANRGSRLSGLHKELLDKVGRMVSSIVFDPEIDQKQAEKIIEQVRMLSRSLPDINFYSDKDNGRIILEVKGDD